MSWLHRLFFWKDIKERREEYGKNSLGKNRRFEIRHTETSKSGDGTRGR